MIPVTPFGFLVFAIWWGLTYRRRIKPGSGDVLLI